MSAALDLQRVFARFVPEYRAGHRLTPRQGQVCAHVRDCRTAALGVLEQHCAGCGFEQVHFASCRDRHCPKCQGRASARWAQREAGNVLAVPYHHRAARDPNACERRDHRARGGGAGEGGEAS